MKRIAKILSKRSGFTIVELLIVVVVIAILAAITIVSYNGITRQAKNAAISVGVSNSIKLLRLYKTENGTWPVENQAAKYSYCLGRNFPLYSASTLNSSPTPVSPLRACGDYNGSMVAESAWLYTALNNYGSLPGPVGANDTHLASDPVYTTVPPHIQPDLQNMTSHPGFTYPSKAPLSSSGNPGSRFYVTFAMVGTDHNCKTIEYAQAISSYAGTSRCVLLLEFFE